MQLGRGNDSWHASVRTIEASLAPSSGSATDDPGDSSPMVDAAKHAINRYNSFGVVVVACMHDRTAVEQLMTALNEKYKLDSLSAGVKVLQIQDAKPLMIKEHQSCGRTLEIGLVWEICATWAHPVLPCLDIHSTAVPCKAVFILGWNRSIECWDVRLVSQEPDLQASKMARLLGTDRELVDAALEVLVPTAASLKQAPDKLKLVQVVDPVLHTAGFVTSRERRVWLSIPQSTWTWKSASHPELEGYTVCISLELDQTMREGQWQKVKWKAQLDQVISGGTELLPALDGPNESELSYSDLASPIQDPIQDSPAGLLPPGMSVLQREHPELSFEEALHTATIRAASPKSSVLSRRQELRDLERVENWAEQLMQMPLFAHSPLPRNPFK